MSDNNQSGEQEKQNQNNDQAGEDQNNVNGSELEALKKEANEYLQGWKRVQADFINYKKEESKRFEEYSRYALESFMKELLTILDSFDLAQSSLDEDNQAQKGIAIMKSQFLNVLKNKGLKEISVAEGEDTFDPRFHESVAEVDSDRPSDTIIEVLDAGYTLYDKVLRPARVKIAK